MIEDIRTYTQNTKLSEHERNELRARISAYIEYHPHTVAHPHTPTQFKGFLHTIQNLIHTHGRVTGSIIGIFVAVIGVVPFFAEQSNPNDSLYAIKKAINEPIQSVFISDTEKQIAFELTRLDRRVEEIRLLSTEGTLGDAEEAKISTELKKHSENIQENIEKLKAEDSETAAVAQANFSAKLSSIDTVVTGITGNSSSTENITNTVKDVLASTLKKAENDEKIVDQSRILELIEVAYEDLYHLVHDSDTELTEVEELYVTERMELIDNAISFVFTEQVKKEVIFSETQATSSNATTTETIDTIVATSTSETASSTIEKDEHIVVDVAIDTSVTSSTSSTPIESPTPTVVSEKLHSPTVLLAEINALITYLSDSEVRTGYRQSIEDTYNISEEITEILEKTSEATSTEETTTSYNEVASTTSEVLPTEESESVQ